MKNTAEISAERLAARREKSDAKRRRAVEAAIVSARIEAAHAETRAIVATGKCPECGAALIRNISLTGWWQCEQLGAVGFRKVASLPSCSWQGFTE